MNLLLWPYTEETPNWRWQLGQGSFSVPRWKATAVHVFLSQISPYMHPQLSLSAFCHLEGSPQPSLILLFLWKQSFLLILWQISSCLFTYFSFFFLFLNFFILVLLSFAFSLCFFCNCLPSFSLKTICLFISYFLWPLNNLCYNFSFHSFFFPFSSYSILSSPFLLFCCTLLSLRWFTFFSLHHSFEDFFILTCPFPNTCMCLFLNFIFHISVRSQTFISLCPQPHCQFLQRGEKPFKIQLWVKKLWRMSHRDQQKNVPQRLMSTVYGGAEVLWASWGYLCKSRS